jgi:hypothetical protein
MRVTSPNGVAAYEGQVEWAGELGRGVPPPLPPPPELDAGEVDG